VPTGIDVKVIVGPGGGEVVTGLGCGMADQVGLRCLNQGINTRPVANIQLVDGERPGALA
jgi:hypothetical protein